MLSIYSGGTHFYKGNLYLKAYDCNKRLEICGNLGVSKMAFGGGDISYCKVKNKLFLQSKSSLHTFLSLFNNLVHGIHQGFYVELSFLGLGYRFLILKGFLLLKLGYAHYIQIKKPHDVHFFGRKKQLFVFGINKDKLNKFAKSLTVYQKLNKYKGKGISIVGEVMKFKVGKQKL